MEKQVKNGKIFHAVVNSSITDNDRESVSAKGMTFTSVALPAVAASTAATRFRDPRARRQGEPDADRRRLQPGRNFQKEAIRRKSRVYGVPATAEVNSWR